MNMCVDFMMVLNKKGTSNGWIGRIDREFKEFLRKIKSFGCFESKDCNQRASNHWGCPHRKPT